ncbi:cobyric acid synthase [Clostridium botulinum]|uniref:Cobyric acid synthase n=3 Tax=Clostridium botulinum TaxID=1491 RepID=COBQ_CLOB6|nr:cobyric acid synthase [Clostridium botulinum]C3L2K4.1 RecName: Full=Cobyric acid synthase [Clostridium botulinum Ba4 str. 657]ACQ53069.1 cobyric acid synthase CobQ [Clostridium botulinum Ba4 str. 657]AJE13137.1 cobyric acid synthase CobQ [Clostridium botulinum CDC_1436]APQ99311.1 cobyric acid synthase CobQ [Clostridium botulinum]AXG91896.1 cobyric acid synthase [Clostridium botulinum]NEZ91915.1 cobyric acid synthase [Clostridium botulinum]
MAKIMIQGTASSVGKSLIVAALCRIFKQDGYSVCPFKSQNMSLNSYITLDGKEMGRAQVLQAYAAGLEPEVYMNPILLKPTSDKKSQIIVNGKVYGNSTAMEYHNLKIKFKGMLKEQFKKLEEDFDIVVMEGAGSPAEINLRDRDIVNMGMAEIVDAPVLLVGDIDKGGVFASLAGTMLLLNEGEKERVKGTIINKFRGDVEILNPGLDMLEDIIHIPCLGVVPYTRLQLEDEDGAVEFNKKAYAPIDIAVIKMPHISNFTDLDALKSEEDVSIRFITSKEEFKEPDLLVIPGSKNTIEDLLYLRKCGLEESIKEYSKDGKIIGICGGYQVLGSKIKDPYKVETDLGEIEGLNLLDMETTFEKEKITTRVSAKLINEEIENIVYGYEIHMGISEYSENVKPLFKIYDKNGEKVDYFDGAINEKGNVMGTYIHGVFDGIVFREKIINELRVKKGLKKKKSQVYEHMREKELDKLADIVRQSLDMEKIYSIIGMK